MSITSSPIAAALEQFEIERANLLARLAKLDHLIAETRDVFHLPAPNGKVPAAARNNKVPGSDHASSKGTPSARTNSKGDRMKDAICAALKAGPLSPADLSARLDQPAARLNYHIRSLEEDGLVVRTGDTTNRRIALAGSRPAKEGP